MGFLAFNKAKPPEHAVGSFGRRETFHAVVHWSFRPGRLLQMTVVLQQIKEAGGRGLLL
jgi:hypothetical protein